MIGATVLWRNNQNGFESTIAAIVCYTNDKRLGSVGCDIYVVGG